MSPLVFRLHGLQIVYVTLGIPIARLADRRNRKVIVGVSLTVWSIMTALCGAAQNFFQLALARVGVGAGEAGAVPPSQSLLADYFPPERRSLALAVFFLSAAAGNVLGLIVGGQIAEAYGWRWTFVVFGLPGVLLALLVWLVLDEPRNLSQFKVQPKDTESFRDAVAVLRKKPAFVNSVIGLVLYYTMIYGALTFSVSFIIRTQSLSLADASAYYGLIGLTAAVIGNPFGGWLTDRLGQRDKAWLARVPGYGFILAFPLFLAAYLVGELGLMLVFTTLGMFVMMMAAPPIFSCLHAVCGSARRATAIAIAYFFANLIGVGLGPVIAGVLSDLFAQIWGEANGLRYALAVMTVLYLPSAFFMLRAGKTMAEDAEA
jgi:MFS family permease